MILFLFETLFIYFLPTTLNMGFIYNMCLIVCQLMSSTVCQITMATVESSTEQPYY